MLEQCIEIFKQTILLNKWIPHKPTQKQAEFLALTCREALYGGAAGGGKSDALLMAALQYVDIPSYSAILFRRSFNDLALPGALMDRAMEWLAGTEAHWDAIKHTWTFPSNATLTFGYLDHENDKFRYQSAEFQYIGFDELTQFLESQYRYLFSRLRRLYHSYVPLRMRAASNPGNIGHDWVKRRFLEEEKKYGRVFIPAKLQDNPHLDQAKYVESLSELDPITRQQYLKGDWSARHGGSKFKREWFTIIDAAPADAKRVRFWDLAATTPQPGEDPDWTAGLKLCEKDGIYYVEDVRRERARPQQIEQLIAQTAALDGIRVDIYIEQEPGSSGVAEIDHYARYVLKGYTFRGCKSTGSKEVRANPVSSAAEAGNVKLVQGKWIDDFLDEVEAFPLGEHDDQVDALSGAFEKLRKAHAWVARVKL